MHGPSLAASHAIRFQLALRLGALLSLLPSRCYPRRSQQNSHFYRRRCHQRTSCATLQLSICKTHSLRFFHFDSFTTTISSDSALLYCKYDKVMDFKDPTLVSLEKSFTKFYMDARDCAYASGSNEVQLGFCFHEFERALNNAAEWYCQCCRDTPQRAFRIRLRA